MRGVQQRIGLALVLLVAAGAVVAGLWAMLAGERALMVGEALAQGEQCLTCHVGIEAIGASHAEMGCVDCHGGNGVATVEDRAHAGMVVNPGDLQHAAQYCGECHDGHLAFVERSLMATYAGGIAQVRRSFGLQPDDTAVYGITAVGGLQALSVGPDDPPVMHQFAENCLSCHIGGEPSAADYHYRSTGCTACHMLYGNEGLYTGGDPTIPRDEAGHALRHEFTTAMPYWQCNHCHNRGNFDLRTMTFMGRDDLPPHAGLSPHDERLTDYYQPIGQFTLCEWELDCVDCHTSQEVMGNGQVYDNRSQAQYVTCATCHGTVDEAPLSMTIASAADLALVRAALNPVLDLAVGDTVLMTERREALWNVRREGEAWVLYMKVGGAAYDLPLATGTACLQNPAEQESRYCHECHAFDRAAVLGADE